jgi:DNA-binding transcriptional ArsR family regulator
MVLSDITDDSVRRLLDGLRDPIRLDIVLLLAGGQRMNVNEITGRFTVSRPAISHHL